MFFTRPNLFPLNEPTCPPETEYGLRIIFPERDSITAFLFRAPSTCASFAATKTLCNRYAPKFLYSLSKSRTLTAEIVPSGAVMVDELKSSKSFSTKKFARPFEALLSKFTAPIASFISLTT